MAGDVVDGSRFLDRGFRSTFWCSGPFVNPFSVLRVTGQNRSSLEKLFWNPIILGV